MEVQINSVRCRTTDYKFMFAALTITVNRFSWLAEICMLGNSNNIGVQDLIQSK